MNEAELSRRMKRNGKRSGRLTAWIVRDGSRPHILIWSLSSDGDPHDHLVDGDSRMESGPE